MLIETYIWILDAKESSVADMQLKYIDNNIN